MKKPLILPRFKNEDEERDFWDKIDITEYFEPSDFKPFVLADLIKKAKKRTRKVTMVGPH
jgi:CopG antitoxin of type II toxin-antitoxin system